MGVLSLISGNPLFRTFYCKWKVLYWKLENYPLFQKSGASESGTSENVCTQISCWFFLGCAQCKNMPGIKNQTLRAMAVFLFRDSGALNQHKKMGEKLFSNIRVVVDGYNALREDGSDFKKEKSLLSKGKLKSLLIEKEGKMILGWIASLMVNFLLFFFPQNVFFSFSISFFLVCILFVTKAVINVMGEERINLSIEEGERKTNFRP